MANFVCGEVLQKNSFLVAALKINGLISLFFSSEENRIDILVKEQSYAVIVENKIHDAIFQRNQLARYINVTKSLTNEDNVFIVLLPYESSDGYIEDIPDSV